MLNRKRGEAHAFFLQQTSFNGWMRSLPPRGHAVLIRLPQGLTANKVRECLSDSGASTVVHDLTWTRERDLREKNTWDNLLNTISSG
jgi:hypothetical protein